MPLGDGVHERADAIGCERLRRYATSGASTGPPALSASGSTPTTLTLPPNQAATPVISPPPPTATTTQTTARAGWIANNVYCQSIICCLTISAVSVKTPVLLFGHH